MTERISRKEFLKAAGWLGASAAVVGTNFAYARRIGQEKYELNPDIMENLGLQADTIAPYITFQGFEQAKELEITGYNKLTPKPRGFAHMLLAMAYYEGGQEAVDKAMKVISERGLEIGLENPHFPGARGGITNPLLMPNKPYHISIRPEYLLGHINTTWHEMYHVHQFVRDGDINFSLIDGCVSAGAFYLIYSLMSQIVDKVNEVEKRILNPSINNTVDQSKRNNSSRRSFLRRAVQLTITTLLFIEYSPFLKPHENQAHTQTDGSNPDTLATDPYFQFDQTKLFDFEK